MSSKASRDYAKSLVDFNLLNKVPPVSGMWQNLARLQVAAGLKDRVDNPDLINQWSSNLCGMAVVIREIAIKDPVQYVWLGLSLFMMGKGRIGRANGLDIVPSTETRRSRVPYIVANNVSYPMDHADWLILASMRDSLNGIFKYTASENGFLGQIPIFGILFKNAPVAAINTPSELVQILKTSLGYQHVVDRTAWGRGAGPENAEKADQFRAMGYNVVLLINHRVLDDKTAPTEAKIATSDHWVGLVSPIEINYFWKSYSTGNDLDRAGVRLTIWHYGKTQRIPGAGDYMPLRNFIKHYYGFIAAR